MGTHDVSGQSAHKCSHDSEAADPEYRPSMNLQDAQIARKDPTAPKVSEIYPAWGTRWEEGRERQERYTEAELESEATVSRVSGGVEEARYRDTD